MKFRLPRPLWIALATVVLVVVGIGVRVGLPIYRGRMAIRMIEQLGGSVVLTENGGPDWLRRQLGDGPMEIFDHVVWVELTATSATDLSCEQLPGLPDLERLQLGYTKLTDAGLIHVGRLSALRALSLDATRISDAGIVHLRGLTNLEELSLRHTRVTDAGLAELGHLPALKLVDVDNTLVTADGVAALKQALPKLQVIGHWIASRK